jgi:dTDP-4-dehydrorhamnose reductase
MENSNFSARSGSASGGKILILGASGNLGEQLVKIFKDENKVIAWDRGEIDIGDKELVIKKISELKPGVIINAAAYNAVDKCEMPEKFEIAKKINGLAPGYLAQAALQVGAVLIHFSSDYVFGGYLGHKGIKMSDIKKQGGFKENDEPRPVNKYGQTKLIGEQEILKLSGKGLKWYLIRTSKLFGPKAESEASKPSFFNIMLNIAREKKELDVINNETSCFTYTPDLAKATKALLDEDKGYGIYHITNNIPRTWYRAAKELFRLAGIKVNVNPVASDKFPRPAKRPKFSVLLNTKLEPLRDYREALKEYLKQLTINN